MLSGHGKPQYSGDGCESTSLAGSLGSAWSGLPIHRQAENTGRFDWTVRKRKHVTMATRTVTELLDDMTGQPADETVAFGLDGVEYEIDMTKKNAAALRKALAPYQDVARRMGGRKQTVLKRVATGVDNRAVRAWAASNGIGLSERGRIPAHVIEQYQAAGN
jgi:hypothetical protein